MYPIESPFPKQLAIFVDDPDRRFRQEWHESQKTTKRRVAGTPRLERATFLSVLRGRVVSFVNY